MNNVVWAIEPFRSVGPVKFGLSPADVQKVLGKAESTFPLPDATPKLEYHSGAIAVSFRKTSTGVDSVAFCNRFGCSGPTLHAKRLLGQPADQVLSWLAEWGYECMPFDGGVDCFDLGISLSVEEDVHGTEIVDVVLVWAEGYLKPEEPRP